MIKTNIYKKASSQIGVAIIVMAILLLLGGIFIDGNQNSKSRYLDNKILYNNGSSVDGNYLFYLNETDIGRQKKVTTSFSNIVLGSKPEFNVIYLGNNFILNANPFTANSYSFDVNFDNPENTNNFLIYFNSIRSSGSQNLIIKVNGKIISDNQGRSSDVPIKANIKLVNKTNKITFELEKPRWYQIFNWNKFEVKELKIIEEKQNRNNNNREFDFSINKDNLERVYVDIAISCDENKEISEPIEVKVNNQIISNSNPNCVSKHNIITADIPINILKNSDINKLELKTNGLYKIAYSINKIYFNDQDVYKFTINSFNDIIDVILYGKFDKDVIDIRLNSQTMSLRKDEIISIIPYLKFGTNELKILTKPIEIKELIVEKNEFIYN